MSVPLITALKRNSLDDGPGIRTTVFFKGCPLRCVWCQNPETKRSAQQISYEAQDCTGCQSCVQACRNNAVLIQADGSFPINQHNCTLSGVLADASVQFRDTGAGYLPVCSREDSAPCAGLCVHACPSEALRFTGKTYSEDELVKSLLKDVVFYKNSGGGVTFSGGEPTLFLAFVSGLAARLKAEGIHLCLETCGSYWREPFEQQLLPYLDLIYFDLKLFDREKHIEYCGVPNDTILDNFTALLATDACEVLPRIPLVPGITTERENLTALRDFLRSCGVSTLGLLPYNPLWLSKPPSLGSRAEYQRIEWMSAEEKAAVKEIFAEFSFRDF